MERRKEGGKTVRSKEKRRRKLLGRRREWKGESYEGKMRRGRRIISKMMNNRKKMNKEKNKINRKGRTGVEVNKSGRRSKTRKGKIEEK